MLKKKVLAVTKLLRMYKMLRQNSEAIVALKQLAPNKKVPFGLLSEGQSAIKVAVSSFGEAKSADGVNERRPSPKGKATRLPARRFSLEGKPQLLDDAARATAEHAAAEAAVNQIASAAKNIKIDNADD
jgi:hypothetical protein